MCWGGDVASLIRASLPPRLVLHTANVLQATEIHTWGSDEATLRWLPPEGRAARLTLAHFKKGGPVYDDALSWLADISGPLLLMLPTELAAALRWELDSCQGLRVGSEAIADCPLVLLHRSAAGECQWGALVPHLTGGTGATRIWQPPRRGTPARRGMTSSPPSTTTGSCPMTRGRRSGRRRSAKTTGAASAPACYSSGTPFASGGTTSGSAVPAPGRRPLTSRTPATSAGTATWYPLQHQRAPTGARDAPKWPRAPGPNHPRSDQKRISGPCTGASGVHKPPHTAARATQAPPFCGST